MLAFLTAAWGEMAWMLEPFAACNGLGWDTVDGVEHPSNFSRRLIGTLERMDEPVVFWSCVDMFFDRPLPVDRFESLARYMVNRGNVVRMGIAEESWPWERLETWDGMEVGCCADLDLCSIHAGLIMDCALFHRENLLRVLEPRWTIWECERRGTAKVLADPGLVSLAVRPGLFRYAAMHDGEGMQYWPADRLFTDGQRESLGWS